MGFNHLLVFLFYCRLKSHFYSSRKCSRSDLGFEIFISFQKLATGTKFLIFFLSMCSSKQEGLVLLLDVGPAMHSMLPHVEKTCSLLLQKKVFCF